MATRNSARRRQRSVRVTVSVILLAVATAAVVLALPTQSPLLLSISSVVAIVLAWAALRIMWTEVLQTRREHHRDRAEQAATYQSLFAERAADHAEFTTAMTERLAAANLTQRELEGALIASQREYAETVVRAESAETALVEAIGRVAELSEELATVSEELASVSEELASQQAEEEEALAALEDEEPSVEQLVAWAERTRARHEATHRAESLADTQTA